MINHFEPSSGFGGRIKPVRHDVSDGFVPIENRVHSNRAMRPERASFKPKAENRVSQSQEKFRCLFPPRKELVTVCAWCDKGIQQGDDRNHAGSWRPMELARFESTGARLTHGICPKCMKTLCHEKELAVP